MLVEECREVLDREGAPVTQHIGMDFVFGCELGDGFLFFEQLEHDLGLEGGCVSRFHSGSLHDPWQVVVRIPWAIIQVCAFDCLCVFNPHGCVRMPIAIPYKTLLRGASLTVLTLFGGMLLGTVAGELVFQALPGHSVSDPATLQITLAAIPALAGLLIGSALWGVLMGRLGQASDWRRMALAGMLGFAPITVALALVLNVVEPVAVEQIGRRFPIHRLFTLLFVPTAFSIAGVSSSAIGLVLRNKAVALALGWRVGLAAALAFLAVNLVMESLGWVIGAPRAEERFTMLTVMLAGNLGAALAGGAVLGWTIDSTATKPV